MPWSLPPASLCARLRWKTSTLQLPLAAQQGNRRPCRGEFYSIMPSAADFETKPTSISCWLHSSCAALAAARRSRTCCLHWRARARRWHLPLLLLPPSSRGYPSTSLSPSPGCLPTYPCTQRRATSPRRSWGCWRAVCIAGGAKWKMTPAVRLPMGMFLFLV